MRYVIAPAPAGTPAFDLIDTAEPDLDLRVVARIWLPLYVVQAMARTLNAHARLAEIFSQPFPAKRRGIIKITNATKNSRP